MTSRSWFGRFFVRTPGQQAPACPRTLPRIRRNRPLVLEELEHRTLLSPVVTVVPIHPQEGALFNGPVATFMDPAGNQPLDKYTATIGWGDGSTSAGTIQLNSGRFTVGGSHTYVEESSPSLKVTVTDSTGNSWSPAKNMTSARNGLASVLGPDHQIYVFGQVGGGSSVEAYDPQTDSWTPKLDMPTPRGFVAAALGTDNLIYVVGGEQFGAPGSSPNVATVEAYDPLHDTWTKKGSLTTPRDTPAAAVGGNGVLYVFGGANTTTGNLATVEAYDALHNSWTRKTPMPTARSELAAATGADGFIYVFGGLGNGGDLNTVEAYDPWHDTWTTKASMPTPTRQLAAATGADGQIYLFGGTDNKGNLLATVEAYNPVANIWTSKAAMTVPRFYLAAAPGANGLLYTFGGLNSSGILPTVETYHPDSPGSALTPLQVTDPTPVVTLVPIAPAQGVPFTGAVATFTDPGGAEAPGNYVASIDWGDGSTTAGTITQNSNVFTVSGSHQYLKEGGTMLTVRVTDDGNPAGTVAWTPNGNTLVGVQYPAAVAGSNGLIYLFGGQDTNYTGNDLTYLDLATVQAYNPVTNTWSVKHSMSARRYAPAAALGRDGLIYVFGGSTFVGGSLNSVEAYNPAADTWVPKANMPTARDGAAAVLGSDGQIYVFGGNAYGGSLGTVEVYNPVTDHWTEKASMPIARSNLAAVSGPDGLIYVFGGSSNLVPNALSTVQAYNPATDTWIPKASMPTARYDIAAAPGGDGLIYVFGGQGINNILSTVEAYDPVNDAWTSKPNMGAARDGPTAALGSDGRIHVFGQDTYGYSTVEGFNPGYHAIGPTGTASKSIQVQGPIATSVTITAPEVTYGKPGLVTVMVAAVSGTPTGNVTLCVDGAAPLTQALVNGSSTFSLPKLLVGKHSLSASYAQQNSFQASAATGTLAVNKAPLIITANSTSKTYGQTVAFVGSEFTISGLVAGDTVTSVTVSSLGAAATASVAGSPYAIVASAAVGTGLDNYAIGYLNGTLTIRKASLTLTAKDATRSYGLANPTFSVSYSGFVNGDTAAVLSGSPSLTTTALPNSPPTQYPITAGPGSLTATNYEFIFRPGSLTVTPALLSALGLNLSATAGGPFSGAVASFANVDPYGTAASYTASITWGDGSTSVGMISGSATLTVTGSHTYADPGSAVVQVQICHNLGYTTPATVSATATVTSLGVHVQLSQMATLFFWAGPRGQALLNSFNGGPTATGLANWLAVSFPKLYGLQAGTHNLFGKTNAQVALLLQTPASTFPDVLALQVLCTALNIYATTRSLGGTTAQAYGFLVTDTGAGANSYSVNTCGAAFGVANGTNLNVYELLRAVNQRAVNGVPYNGDVILCFQAYFIFEVLNVSGDIY